MLRLVGSRTVQARNLPAAGPSARPRIHIGGVGAGVVSPTAPAAADAAGLTGENAYSMAATVTCAAPCAISQSASGATLSRWQVKVKRPATFSERSVAPNRGPARSTRPSRRSANWATTSRVVRAVSSAAMRPRTCRAISLRAVVPRRAQRGDEVCLRSQDHAIIPALSTRWRRASRPSW